VVASRSTTTTERGYALGMTGSRAYRLAQELVAQGLWRVDPETGYVHGVKGQPFRRTNSWGYVQIKFRDPADWRANLAVLAHRVIWEAVHGSIDLDLVINHLNGVKTDNRLANLELVSQSANMLHAHSTGLHVPTRPMARLSEDAVLSVYRRAWAGERDSALAAEYGVSRSAISNIRHGWSWSHLTRHQPRPAVV
jgi:hypothetical protein